MQTTNVSLKHVLLIFIIAAAVLILPGSDVYTHTHEAWLYNYMLQNKAILTKDPSMLSGQQPIYDRSIPAYLMAGIGWFVFQKSVIKVLEVLLLLGVVLLTQKIFQNKGMLLLWYALLFGFILELDSYPYFLSVFLFYLGIYLIKRFEKKPFGDFAIMLAGINHPYVAASNLITAILGRKLLTVANVLILLAQIMLIKLVFFAGLVNFDFYNVLHFVVRSMVLYFPFYADMVPRPWSRIVSEKGAYIAAFSIIFVAYPLLSVVFGHGLSAQLSCYYTKTYAEIPTLNGNVRIVDDCRAWTYVFPLRGIVSSLSTEFQGQYYHIGWLEDKYLLYLIASNTSYVIFCKDCDITTGTFKETGELNILERNFPVYNETREYIIFDVAQAAELYQKYARLGTNQTHKSKIISMIKNLTRFAKKNANDFANTT